MRAWPASAAVLSLAVTLHAQSKRPAYVADLEAFFDEVEAHYPFFEVKGIRADWKRHKKGLLKRAKSCKSFAGTWALVAILT